MNRILLAVLALVSLPAFAQPDMTLTQIGTYNNTSHLFEARLRWELTEPAASCAASGDWSGSKNVNGAEEYIGDYPNTATKTWTLQCNWAAESTVDFAWTPVTLNADDSPYTNPSIVRIKYTFGATAPTLNDACAGAILCVDVDDTTTPRPTSKQVTVSQTGTVKAIAVAINAFGAPGAPTAVATHVVPPASSVSRTVVLTFPNAPGDFTVN